VFIPRRARRGRRRRGDDDDGARGGGYHKTKKALPEAANGVSPTKIETRDMVIVPFLPPITPPFQPE